MNAVSAVGRRPLTTTEDQSATFIELFFDLVFVYAVTQTVTLVHDDRARPFDAGVLLLRPGVYRARSESREWRARNREEINPRRRERYRLSAAYRR